MICDEQKKKKRKTEQKIYRHCFSWDFCKILQLLHHLYLMISSIDDDDDVGSVMITINLLWFDHTMDQHKKKKINSCQSCTVVSFLFFFVLLLPKLSLFSLPPINSGWLCCIMMDFFFFFFLFLAFRGRVVVVNLDTTCTHDIHITHICDVIFWWL